MSLRLRARIFNVLLASLALLAPAVCLAETLPDISEHSDLSFAIYQGDTVTVTVKAAGHDLQAKWFKGHTIFCTSFECDIDTSSWELGLHRLVFVVFNSAGSKFVRYSVKVLAAPSDHVPTKVHPALVPASPDFETVNAYELTVKALRGRGYAYHQKKLQVLGPSPRALDWTESLKTAKRKAVLNFGRVGAEAHTLGSDSTVQLLTSDEGRRAIVLRRGVLRSRSLGTKEPRWSVVVPDLVQIDTDADADILVATGAAKASTKAEDPAGEDATPEDDKEAGDSLLDEPKPKGEQSAPAEASDRSATITVLRGHARIFIRSLGEQKGEDAGSYVEVGPGLALTVRPDEEPDRPELPDVAATAALMMETSAQYLPGRWEEGLADGLSYTAVTPKTKTLKAALSKAHELEDDPIQVLELLLPRYADGKKDYAFQLSLGRAYKSLFLIKPATAALKAAAALNPDAAEPPFELGELALLTQDWPAAIKALAEARSNDAEDTQRVNYELGVAAFYAKDFATAAGAFDRALWAEGYPELTASARAFRQRLKPTRWYELRAEGGLFYDSNILHSNSLKPDSLGLGLTTNKGAGYKGSAGFSLWPWRTPDFGLEIAFDDAKTGYLTKSLNQLAVIDQCLGLHLSAGWGGGDGAKYFTVGLGVFARAIAIGGQQALDELGEVLTLASPVLLNLHASFEPTTTVDPLPARTIIVDPVLWEVVTPGDRSAHMRYYTFGLVPVSTDQVQLALDLRTGKTTYTSSFEREESYRDTGEKVRLDYSSTSRSRWTLGLGQTKRTFTEAEDGRKDTLLEVQAAWRRYFIPALSQTLELGYDKQQSSREVNRYTRTFVAYHLNWVW